MDTSIKRISSDIKRKKNVKDKEKKKFVKLIYSSLYLSKTIKSLVLMTFCKKKK